MTQIIKIHTENPQQRLLQQAVEILTSNKGVVAYPTDSGYALGCLVGNKDATLRIRAIRQLTKDHNFTLMCSDLSLLATYAKVDNTTFKLLKAYTPGQYTFILEATKEVPNRLQHPKRKTIGLRIPDNRIALSLLKELGEPLMSVTLLLPGNEFPLADADEIQEKLEGQIDVIIDGGFCGNKSTTVVDFVINGNGTPEITRVGKGDPTPFIVKERV